MRRSFFICILLTLLTGAAFSQHCRWDGTSMIMLDISKSPSIQVRDIYLLDSAGAVVINKHLVGGKSETDTAKFWKNPARPTQESGSNVYGQYFPFAKEYMIVAFGGTSQPKPFRVVINYRAGGTNFKKDLPLLNNHIHSLCTNNEELWKGHAKPMSVLL